MPAAELCDQPVTIEQVWGRSAIADLRDRLAAADGPHEMLTLLEKELMRRLCEAVGLGLVRRTSSVMAATSGAVAIGDLSETAGVSSTHLAQRFKELIGVTPKRLARTYRFAATVFAIDPDGPVDWADLAAARRLLRPGPLRPRVQGFHRAHADPRTSNGGGGSCANIPATCWTAGRCRPIDFLQERSPTPRYVGAP